MAHSTRPIHFNLLTQAARLGQAAWLFGNVYEAAVGMPQLLNLARAERPPGLVGVGSPVRYFAPIAPLAVAASAMELEHAWRSHHDRQLVLASAGGLGLALGLSGYLIRTVNVSLLSASDVAPADQRRLETTWHHVNRIRIAALAGSMAVSWFRDRRH